MVRSLFLILECALAVNWILDSGYYFAIKDRQETLNLGLMWGTEYKLSHEMLDHSIHLSVPYADPGTFYIQKAHDPSLHIEITQTWRISDNSWDMIFEANPKSKLQETKPKPINVIIYGAVLSGSVDYLDMAFKGAFDMKIEASDKLIVRSLQTQDVHDKAWKAKKFVQKWLYDSFMSKKTSYGTLTPASDKDSNIFFIQMITFAPFYIRISYNNFLGPSVEVFTAIFEAKFQDVFGNPKDKSFEYGVLGYLLSGLGHFRGKIQILDNEKVIKSEEGVLLSFVPSRVSFPRGFLWDEGFHLLVACRWNPSLCLDIFDSWLGTMDENGWIPREQIRGPAAETRVPSQFISQSKNIANPPSFVFLIEDFLDKLESISPEARSQNPVFNCLSRNYRKLKKWYFWILGSQINSDGFPMWKGRSSDHNLASGLDDYPRGLQVRDNERHLDLYMWLLALCRSLKRTAGLVEDYEDVEVFAKSEEKLLAMEKNFLDDDGAFKDHMGQQYVTSAGLQAYYWRGDNKCKTVQSPLGLSSECNPYSEFPCCSEFGWCGNTPDHCNCPKCSRSQPLEKRNNLSLKGSFSPHIGYVNLMPLITGHVKVNSKSFNKILDFIQNPEYLWSPHGLRSLSKSDILFKTGENYWRGEIWLNFNYLVLRGIKKHYWDSDRARKIYKDLSQNLINTVNKAWNDTGYIWEQYTEDNGNGNRVHPFSGWSSLILNIAYEKY